MTVVRTIRAPRFPRVRGARSSDYRNARSTYLDRLATCIERQKPKLQERVPYMTGQLRRSAFVERRNSSVAFGFTDPKSPYVVFRRGRVRTAIRAVEVFRNSRDVSACKRVARAESLEALRQSILERLEVSDRRRRRLVLLGLVWGAFTGILVFIFTTDFGEQDD